MLRFNLGGEKSPKMSSIDLNLIDRYDNILIRELNMNNFEDIIKIAQQFLCCPICKRRYNFDEIKLRGWLDNIYFLQVDCDNNHKPISISVAISSEPINKNIINVFKKQTIVKKSKDNNNLMVKDLKDFNGDFESLWKK